MHLFGDTKGPHMAHFHAWRHDESVELSWEVRNAAAPLMWRILRSEVAFAARADASKQEGQTLVMEGPDTHLRDRGLVAGHHYYYTLFASVQAGDWERQVETVATPKAHLLWRHPDVEKQLDAEKDFTTSEDDKAIVQLGYGQANLRLVPGKWAGKY